MVFIGLSGGPTFVSAKVGTNLQESEIGGAQHAGRVRFTEGAHQSYCAGSRE